MTLKNVLKHKKQKAEIKVDEEIFLVPYGKNYHKIYKSIVSKLISIYVSAYKGIERFRYKTKRQIRKHIRWLINRCWDNFYLIYIKRQNKRKLVGFIGIEFNWFDEELLERGAIIHEFAIRKEYQSRGIGGKVLRYLLNNISRYNIKKIILTVGEDNEKALRFYEKLGFKKVQKDITEKHKDVIWVYMIKEL